MSITQQHQTLAGWHAQLELGFRRIDEKTVLSNRLRLGPLTVQRPFYPEGDVCHVYLLHPPGGVVGGDVIDVKANVTTDAHALLTTPGATKFYRSAGEFAHQRQNLSVEAGGALEWFPQENIFFPEAKVVLETTLDLHGDARIAMWDIQCFGRPTNQEIFSKGEVRVKLQVNKNAHPYLIEDLSVDSRTFSRASLMRGCAVNGFFLMNGASKEHLDLVRKILENEAQNSFAASLIEDTLVTRYLGNMTETARRVFTMLWTALRKDLIKKPAHLPRIWQT